MSGFSNPADHSGRVSVFVGPDTLTGWRGEADYGCCCWRLWHGGSAARRTPQGRGAICSAEARSAVGSLGYGEVARPIPGVVTVTNRQLRIAGDGMGYPVTGKSFRDFHLAVEWRWGQTNRHSERVGRARDSGIFVHVTVPAGNSHDGAGAFRAGLEQNLMGVL